MNNPVLMLSSNTGHSSRRHGDNSHGHRSTSSRRTSHRTPAHGSDHINGDQDHPPQVYEPPYNSAHTYSMYRPEPPVPVPHEFSSYNDQIYNLSTQFQTYASAPYDHELTIEEEQCPATVVDSQQYTSYPNGNRYTSNEYSQTPAPGYNQPQTPLQHYPVQQNGSTSATTAGWSTQGLADERRRLGLSPYATEAEVEAARRACQEASQQASQ
jgi:hypothetical protein